MPTCCHRPIDHEQVSRCFSNKVSLAASFFFSIASMLVIPQTCGFQKQSAATPALVHRCMAGTLMCSVLATVLTRHGQSSHARARSDVGVLSTDAGRLSHSPPTPMRHCAIWSAGTGARAGTCVTRVLSQVMHTSGLLEHFESY
jgi:hypothetical protein